STAQSRAIIEQVSPEINCGRFYAKRTVGETFTVEADIFADGHDIVAGELQYRHEKSRKWMPVRFEEIRNDRWQASFPIEKQGFYHYRLEAWVDYALTWQHNLKRKADDGQFVQVEIQDGVQYLAHLSKVAGAKANAQISEWMALFQDPHQYEAAKAVALSEALHDLFVAFPSKDFSVVYDHKLRVYADRKKARFSAWYEFFPRSASPEPGRHGTFKDCENLLPRVAEMGFDTLYFPPVHPIGEVHRKGKNNATTAQPDDVGSPWGIGSKYGGHKEIHPELGTLEDFRSLIRAAEKLGIEIAMDFALQCAPDHPYVKEHPQWFRWRPDGSVQYAEN
ncbi:MAG: DUF3416 domain-containing protein, partial [Bacteroidetes bacterium]